MPNCYIVAHLTCLFGWRLGYFPIHSFFCESCLGTHFMSDCVLGAEDRAVKTKQNKNNHKTHRERRRKIGNIKRIT